MFCYGSEKNEEKKLQFKCTKNGAWTTKTVVEVIAHRLNLVAMSLRNDDYEQIAKIKDGHIPI